MINMPLAVSAMTSCAADAQRAMAVVPPAFAPFGINLQPIPCTTLALDPAATSDGWFNLIEDLERWSGMRGRPAPPHIVFTRMPTGADPTLNGQLMERMRGVCAIFLDADIFQIANPEQRLSMIVQVCVHELGHVLNLTHADGAFQPFYTCSMMPTHARLKQAPQRAWELAASDAQLRGEQPIQTPNPVRYFPFGAQCRANLRAAAFDWHWWPWLTPFRGNFDEPVERSDQGLEFDFAQEGVLRTFARDGLAFGIAIRNSGRTTVALPMHIGPEYGTLRVIVEDESGQAVLYQPESARCSAARMALRPGELLIRSFSLIPHPDAPLFPRKGVYACRVSLLSEIGTKPVCLGVAMAPVVVGVSPIPASSQRAALRVVSAARRSSPPPNSADKSRAKAAITQGSVAADHARYKMAITARKASTRIRLLRKCMDAAAHTAVLHRAARRWAMEMLMDGRSMATIRQTLVGRFGSPEHKELHETIDRMEDGWKRHTTPLA